MKHAIFSLLGFLLFNFSSGQDISPEWGHGFVGGWSKSDEVATDSAGNTYIIGTFSGTIDVDPGPAVRNLSSPATVVEIFLVKLDAYGDFEWAQNISRGANTDSAYLSSMAVDPQGNVFIAGTFTGSVDFDPGPGSFILTSTIGQSNTDLFALKLDAQGNFLWAKRTGNEHTEGLAHITSDQQGNLYTTGNFFGNLDVDPGADSTIFVGTSGDIFIQKLDPSGDFIWANKLDKDSWLTATYTQTDAQGNYLLLGSFRGTMDFDPGPAVQNRTSFASRADRFLLKLSPAGTFDWVRQTQGTNVLFTDECEVDSAGNIILVGNFSGTVNFDPAGTQTSLTSGSNGLGIDAFIQKIDAQGTHQWINNFGSYHDTLGGNVHITNLDLDDRANIIIHGFFSGSIDFDPGLAQDSLQSPGGWTIDYFASYNSAGEYIWTEKVSKPIRGGNYFRDLALSSDLGFYAVGSYEDAIDFDPGPGTYNLPPSGNNSNAFVIKYKQGICSALGLSIDSLKNVDCNSPGYISGHAFGSSRPYQYQWDTNPAVADSFISTLNRGLYRLTVTDANACSRSSQVIVSGPLNPTGNDFKVNLHSTDFRPGRKSEIWLDVFNDGCSSNSDSVNIYLSLDPLLNFVGADIPPDTVFGSSTYQWTVDGLNYGDEHVRIRVEVMVSLQAQIGDNICLDARVNEKNGTGGNTKSSNRQYCLPLVNSYDPNDKQVYPQGLCEEGFIERDERLTYTLRFQNTGNASAIDIFLLDTLDAHLDMSSLQIVGQSHKPMITEVLRGKVLKFRFDNINLPDSTTDEENSHGYVIFEIDPLPDAPVGSEIKNSTSIYFDFNEPVKTNTVRNTLLDVIPENDTTRLQVESCSYSYILNRRTYTESGRFYQVFSREANCDSVVVLDLVLQALDTTISQTGNTLTANEGGAHGLNVSYQWVDCDNGNAPISGATSQNFTPESNGNYAVIISKENCSEMSSCMTVSTVGIDPGFQAELRYYPNPTTDALTIELGASYPNTEVEIVNALGQRFDQRTFDRSDRISMQLPTQKGLYFVKVKAEGRVAVLKIFRK